MNGVETLVRMCKALLRRPWYVSHISTQYLQRPFCVDSCNESLLGSRAFVVMLYYL
jgi:hypothetical protein